MKISRLVLGTTNPGKIAEWKLMLNPLIPIMAITDLGDWPPPPETGLTFADNAKLKAVYYAKLTGEYMLAEDGGYEVDALGGWPGIRSRRILPGGKEGTDQDLIDYVLKKLKGVPTTQRTVRLTTAVAVVDTTGKIIYQDQASSTGLVAEKVGPILITGYPFRSIHFLPKLGKTYAELTPEEHQQYSHKRRIAQRLAKFLKQFS